MRRIRHLRSLAARNVKCEDGEITALHLHFTLHTSSANPAFYTSETITGSVNPTWKTFTLEHLALEEVNTAKTTVVVRVWRTTEGASLPAIEWTVCLSGLLYFGDKLQKEVPFSRNTLLFGMFNGFYLAPAPKDTPIRREPRECVLSVDRTLVRKSYSISTTDRIQTIQRVVKQTEQSGRVARKDIERALSQSQYKKQRKSAREAVAMRVAMLQADLDWRTDRLRQEKDRYEGLQTHNIRRDRHLQDKANKLHNDRARLREKKKAYFNVREDLIKTGAQLVMRRKQLISELTLIYPIVESPNDEYNILGIVLPNSEKFQGFNETQLEVALGYTCHLVHMISQFLDMPLRYPMMHRGSKSVIHDSIIDKLSDKERDNCKGREWFPFAHGVYLLNTDLRPTLANLPKKVSTTTVRVRFPLYSKGRERFQFDYGVYLLNKNIAQLRYYCGLGTTDLRLTLANLKTLLQLRLGVKFDHLETLRHAQLQSASAINRKMTSRNNRKSPPKNSPRQDAEVTSVRPKAQSKENNERHAATKKHGVFYEDGSIVSSESRDTTDSRITHSSDILAEEKDIFKGSPDSFFNIQLSDTIETEAEEGRKGTSGDVTIPFLNYDKSSTFQSSPNKIIDTNTQGQTGDSAHILRPEIHVDYDGHSVSSDSQTTRQQVAPQDSAPITTLEQLTKEKLLGPIANYDDIDVSSSEDSANAAYGQQFRFLREQTTFQSLVNDNAVIEEYVLNDDITNDGGHMVCAAESTQNMSVTKIDNIPQTDSKLNDNNGKYSDHSVTNDLSDTSTGISKNGLELTLTECSLADETFVTNGSNRPSPVQRTNGSGISADNNDSSTKSYKVPDTLMCNTSDAQNNSEDTSCKTPDEACSLVNSDSSPSSSAMRVSHSEPIDVNKQSFRSRENSDDSYLLDSSPTFRLHAS